MTEPVHIRRMAEEDIPKVIKLVKESFGDESEFYLDYYPIDIYFPIVVAESEQRIVGAATTYLNRSHPEWLKVMVAVDENFRTQGIGRGLHDAALKARVLEHDIKGLQGHCYKGEDEAENFMKALGYTLCLTCHILELDLTRFEEAPTLPANFQDLKIVGFTELLESTIMKQQLYDFLLSRYIEEHFWSPPVSKEHPDWEGIVFDDLRPELSFALLDGERIVAASNVLNENPRILDLCWFYSTLEYGQETARSFLKVLLAHMFREARQVGLVGAALELDSTERDKQGLLEWLPVQKEQLWQILQKPLLNE